MKKRLSFYALVLFGIVSLVALVVFVPQSESLRKGVDAVQHTNKAFFAYGLALMCGTYLMASLALQKIALKPIRFQRTFLVQVASGFATKLAPAGIGGFALNSRYLAKNKHSLLEAGSVMSLNGMLGFSGHMLVLLLGVVFFRKSFSKTVNFHAPSQAILNVVVFIMLLALIFALIYRKKIKKNLLELLRTLRQYRRQPDRLVEAFLCTTCVTVLFATILYVSAFSLGFALNAAEIFLAYTATAIGAAITPTPGGIGGAEAALTAVLVAFGLDTSAAFSVALVYRFITFWLPVIPGILTFQLCLRRKYI